MTLELPNQEELHAFVTAYNKTRQAFQAWQDFSRERPAKLRKQYPDYDAYLHDKAKIDIYDNEIGNFQFEFDQAKNMYLYLVPRLPLKIWFNYSGQAIAVIYIETNRHALIVSWSDDLPDLSQDYIENYFHPDGPNWWM